MVGVELPTKRTRLLFNRAPDKTLGDTVAGVRSYEKRSMALISDPRAPGHGLTDRHDCDYRPATRGYGRRRRAPAQVVKLNGWVIESKRSCGRPGAGFGFARIGPETTQAQFYARVR
jgi:hypothetical protein